MILRDKNEKSLCVLNKTAELQVSESVLANIRNISSPMAFYGGYPELNIAYVSDIHLDTIQNKRNNISECIRDAVKSLYDTMPADGVIIFGGDISDDYRLTIDFYTRFVKYKSYLEYLKIKKNLNYLKRFIVRMDIIKETYSKRISGINEYVEQLKSQFTIPLDFNNIIRYKNLHYEGSSWETTITNYLNGSTKIVKDMTDGDKTLLMSIATYLDKVRHLQFRFDRFISSCETHEEEKRIIETSCCKLLDDITIADVCVEHHKLTDDRFVVAVLGNHDYIGFDSIADALNYYKPVFKKLDIHLIQNDSIEYENRDKKYIIYGGTGFAKYNDKYNADTLVCCNNFSRKDEIHETDLFESNYLKTKKSASSQEACLICVSHYPVVDCHANVDSDVIYFCGHDHRNYYCRNELAIIYADNQLGYNSNDISFKEASINGELNPYWFLSDGIYNTSVEEYLQFYRYIGEGIGNGKLLRKRCDNANVNMYVIKRNDYYGFFIVNTSSGQSKGISIVNGGITKKITKLTDVQWLFNNFDIVLSKYLQVLTPLRTVQEKISTELQDLGFHGTIHGCIIDVDYYHHIMLNPLDGSMTYYYSSTFGMVRPLSSFDNVILSVQKHDDFLHRDYKQITEIYHSKKQQKGYLLGKRDDTYLLEIQDSSIDALSVAEQIVSRSEGMYGVSRKVKSLERIFTAHVLRDFDLSLVDEQPIIEKSIKSNAVRKKDVQQYFIGTSISQQENHETTLINYKSYKNVDVEFEDGEKLTKVSFEDWQDGKLLHPIERKRKMEAHRQEIERAKELQRSQHEKDRLEKTRMKNKYVGVTKKMSCGLMATIIEYNNCRDCVVEFENGKKRSHVRPDKFMAGHIAPKFDEE